MQDRNPLQKLNAVGPCPNFAAYDGPLLILHKNKPIISPKKHREINISSSKSQVSATPTARRQSIDLCIA